MTYVAKIYQIDRSIYSVLNTHNLDMILYLKYMPIVMNPARIASSDWKSSKCYGLWYALSLKRVQWPPIFFYVFNVILSSSTCSQSFNKNCTWEVLGANVLKFSKRVVYKSVKFEVVLQNNFCQSLRITRNQSFCSKLSHRKRGNSLSVFHIISLNYSNDQGR